MTNLVAFCNEVTSLVDKWKAVDVVCSNNYAFTVVKPLTLMCHNFIDKLTERGLDK